MADSGTHARIAPSPEAQTSSERIPVTDPLLGSIVDSRYLIERAVGSGGFGNVYRAVHLRFDSPVAIKVLRISSRLSEAERQRFIDLFLAEGKLLFNLGALHSSIVRVFEAGTLRAGDGLLAPYLVMEWLDGIALDRAIRRRAELGSPRLELLDVIALLSSCVEGLSRAHEKRVAHRDIKPGNIFLVKQDGKLTTKLLDFGLAKAASETTSISGMYADSSPGDCSFTPAYGAPEQWLRRLGATGSWTDVYALALVCVELLVGSRALGGSDGNQLMAACLDESVRPTPRTLGAGVSDEAETVFRKALTVDPRHRYREVSDFWQALRHAASHSKTTGSSERHHSFASLACDEWLGDGQATDASGEGLREYRVRPSTCEGETADLPQPAADTRSNSRERSAARWRGVTRNRLLATGGLSVAALTFFVSMSGGGAKRVAEHRSSPLAFEAVRTPAASVVANTPSKAPFEVELVAHPLSDSSDTEPVAGNAVRRATAETDRRRGPVGHRSMLANSVARAPSVLGSAESSAVAPHVPSPQTRSPSIDDTDIARPQNLLHHDALSRRK